MHLGLPALAMMCVLLVSAVPATADDKFDSGLKDQKRCVYKVITPYEKAWEDSKGAKGCRMSVCGQSSDTPLEYSWYTDLDIWSGETHEPRPACCAKMLAEVDACFARFPIKTDPKYKGTIWE